MTPVSGSTGGKDARPSTNDIPIPNHLSTRQQAAYRAGWQACHQHHTTTTQHMVETVRLHINDEPSGRVSDTATREVMRMARVEGGAIRAHRKAQGMTQAELAERALISRNHVGRVERGEQVPRRSTRLLFAAALGVGHDDLFTVEGD